MNPPRTDLNDLACQFPEKVKSMIKDWEGCRDSVHLPKGWRDPKVFSDQ